jgi:hypothetical protein
MTTAARAWPYERDGARAGELSWSPTALGPEMPWPYPCLDGRPADDPQVLSLADEISDFLGRLGYTSHAVWWNAATVTTEGPLSRVQLWHRCNYDAVNDLFMTDAEVKGVPLPHRRVRGNRYL